MTKYCLCLSLIILVGSAAYAATVESVKGSVSISKSGQIETGPTGKARIQLNDGSEIVLAPNSQLDLDSEDPEDKTKSGYLQLISGKLRALIRKKLNSATPSFKIRTSTATMGVRGTEFLVEAARDSTAVCTFEGSVEVASASDQSQKTLVAANEGVVVSADGKLSAPVTMDPVQMNWWRQETSFGKVNSEETNLRLIGTDWQWNGPTAVESKNPQALYSKYSALALGASLWGRTIYTDEVPLSSSAQTHEQVNATGRLGLDATFTPNKHLLFFGEIMGALKAGHTNGDRTKFIFQQGFALARSQSGHSVALGRQEWNFGDGLILGRDPWSPVTRTFDGALATLRFAPVRVRTFAAALGDRVDSTDLDDFVAGSYIEFSKLPIDLYGLWVKRKGNRLVAVPSNISSSHGIIGERVQLGPWKSLFLNEEFAYQIGKIGVANSDRDLSAFLGYVDAGSMWKLGSVSGFAKAVYLRASGDSNPNDNKHGSFMQLLPDTHRFLGLINAFPQMRNIERMGGSVAAHTEVRGLPVTAQFDYSYFNRLSLPETFQPIQNASEKFLGQEYDLQLGFEPHPKAFIQFGVGYLLPGKALRLNSDNGLFSFLMAQYRLN